MGRAAEQTAKDRVNTMGNLILLRRSYTTQDERAKTETKIHDGEIGAGGPAAWGRIGTRVQRARD
jgi:hypothetical protein